MGVYEAFRNLLRFEIAVLLTSVGVWSFACSQTPRVIFATDRCLATFAPSPELFAMPPGVIDLARCTPVMNMGRQ